MSPRARLGAALGAAGVVGFLAVAAGAFGAHALESRLLPDALSLWDKGVDYLMFASLGLVSAGLMALVGLPRWRTVVMLHVAGAILFSGSLMALAILRLDGAEPVVPTALVLATPAGGLCWLAAWGLMAFTALRAAASPSTPAP